MKEPPSSSCGLDQGPVSMSLDEQTLILSNLRLSVEERWKRHDAALNTLNELRALVRQVKFIQEQTGDRDE